MQSETFIFFGIHGSGKGTQVKLLQDVLKKKDGKEQVYAYPGAEYKRLIESGSYTGSLVKSSYERGELQSDVLTNSIFVNILTSSLTAEKHIITDGYPRTIAQSEALETMMHFYGRENIKIIFIKISAEEGMKRNLLRGRLDDTKESITMRLAEYENKIVPAMNYFKGKERYEIFTINGAQSIEDVHKDIIKALDF